MHSCIHIITLLRTALIFIITFGAILPLTIWNKPFSFYFVMDEEEAVSVIQKKNDERVEKAVSFIENSNNETIHQFYERRLNSVNLHLLIMIVTTIRSHSNSENLQYVTQSAIFTHQEILKHNQINAALLICNVDPMPHKHAEASQLSNYFPSISKYKEETSHLSVYEKEKVDYSFCLERAEYFFPKYVLLLEDDSIPQEDMLSHLNYIIKFKLEKFILNGDLRNNMINWLALKLYYPEGWMGFGYELYRMLQLIAVGFLFSGFFVFFIQILSSYRSTHQTLLMLYIVMIIGFIYGLLFALAVGRQNLLEILRFHPSLFQIIKAPGCCTPATLYPTNRIKGLIKYLNTIKCTSTYGLDLAIDDYAKENNLIILQTEPNLFLHIGFHSTLKSSVKERKEEFLI